MVFSLDLNPDTVEAYEWSVRVLNPRVILFSYPSKRSVDSVHGSKFTCLLEDEDPTEYMQEIVRFDLKEMCKCL